MLISLTVLRLLVAYVAVCYTAPLVPAPRPERGPGKASACTFTGSFDLVYKDFIVNLGYHHPVIEGNLPSLFLSSILPASAKACVLYLVNGVSGTSQGPFFMCLRTQKTLDSELACYVVRWILVSTLRERK